ncbi:MAG TPA: tetratricopeptide repeat protein [Candidatus Eremiobacteraceae bacterium]|nr:tetratricopeptide repeat protein [Candidatus Eremiobacteraceae bacterium]
MTQSILEHTRDLVRLGDLDRAGQIAEAEIERVEDRGSTAELWQFRFVKAEALRGRGRVEEALMYLESLAGSKIGDIESGAGLKMHRGYLSGCLGRHEPAHRLLGEAEEMARQGDLITLVGDVCLSRAFIFFRQKDYAASDLLFHSVLDIAVQIGGWYYRGHALWGIGKNLMIQEHYVEAMTWLNEALAIFEDVGARSWIATVWSEMAVCYLGLGDDARAMELLCWAEKVDHEAGAVHNYQVVLANIGNVYLYRRDHFTAISYYQRALALAREIKDPVSIKKWTRNINLAYARIRLAVDQSNPSIA